MVYLKAGIAVVVTTWENDADNYTDTTLSGMTKECALAVKNFCELFRSRNSNRHVPGFGNTDGFEFGEVKQKMLPSDLELIEKELDMDVYSLFDELIGCWNEGDCIRVFEQIKFLEVPTDIKEITL